MLSVRRLQLVEGRDPQCFSERNDYVVCSQKRDAVITDGVGLEWSELVWPIAHDKQHHVTGAMASLRKRSKDWAQRPLRVAASKFDGDDQGGEGAGRRDGRRKEGTERWRSRRARGGGPRRGGEIED